jgi:hypothetical protein
LQFEGHVLSPLSLIGALLVSFDVSADIGFLNDNAALLEDHIKEKLMYFRPDYTKQNRTKQQYRNCLYVA